MNDKSARQIGLVAVASLSVLIASACSSGSGKSGTVATSSGPAGASSSSSVPKPTKSQIVIGQLVAQSGINGPAAAASADVGQAWEKWVNNDLGGINGHPVKVVIQDTKSDSATASTSAQSMLQNDKIIALVGSNDAATDPIFTKTFVGAQVPIPVVGGNISSGAVATSSPYIYSIVPPGPTTSVLGVDQAKSVGAKKVGVVLCSELAVCLQAEPVFKNRAESIGLTWGGLVQVAAATPNYTAACLSLRDTGTDYLILGVTNQVAVRVVADCVKQGYNPSYWGSPSGTFDGNLLPALSNSGARFAGTIGGFPWYLNTPAIKQYRDVLTKYGANHTYNQNQGQSITWASFELFRKAMMSASDNPTAAEVSAALFKIKDDDLGGLLPQKISFTEGQPSKALTCAWWVTLDKGVFGGGDTHCATS